MALFPVGKALGTEFSDMTGHWADDTVRELAERQIVSGYTDGTFKPEENVDVDAYIKMAITASGKTISTAEEGYWAKPYISEAVSLKIVSDGEFDRYDRSITRYEMCFVSIRALESVIGNVSVTQTEVNISDITEIRGKYREYVVKAFALGIMNGYDDFTFRGKETATRAEAAVVISRLIDELGKEREDKKETVNELTEISGMQTILPDDENLIYTGRIDFDDSKSPKLLWSGTSLSFKAKTEKLKIVLKENVGGNYYSVFINNDYDNPVILLTKGGLNVYDVDKKLEFGEHTFEIFKRTEISVDATIFKGIYIDEKGQMLEPPKSPKLKIEFFGDSITAGTGVEDEPPRTPNNNSDRKYQNNFLTYAAITARNIDAEMHCTAKAGIALTDTYGSLPPMTEFYDKLNPYSSPMKEWDFSQWIPDIVVVNLMSNDIFIGMEQGNTRHTKMAGSEQAMIEIYEKFISDIREKYPDAYIICTLGNMTGTKKDSFGNYSLPHPDYIKTVVKNMEIKYGDRKVFDLMFEDKNTPAHPVTYEHQAMADKLTDFIKSVVLPKLKEEKQ